MIDASFCVVYNGLALPHLLFSINQPNQATCGLVSGKMRLCTVSLKYFEKPLELFMISKMFVLD